MTLKIGKLFIGASLALSLGGFAIPGSASIAPFQRTSSPGFVGQEAPILMQYADEGNDSELKYKVESNVNEGEDETRAAKNEIKMRHRARESTESDHDGVMYKTESNLDEVHHSAGDAKDGAQTEHRDHEATEGEH